MGINIKGARSFPYGIEFTTDEALFYGIWFKKARIFHIDFEKMNLTNGFKKRLIVGILRLVSATPLFVRALLPVFIFKLFNIEDIDTVFAMNVLYVFYLSFFVLTDELKRYHGAEHKLVNVISDEKDLTIENLERASIVTRNCGGMVLAPAACIMPIFVILLGFNIYSLFLAILAGSVVVDVHLRRTSLGVIGDKCMSMGDWFQRKHSVLEPEYRQKEVIYSLMKRVRDFYRE